MNIEDVKKDNPKLMNGEARCPVAHGSSEQHTNSARSNKDWWPEQINLSILHQHDRKSDPMGDDFDYKKEFQC